MRRVMTHWGCSPSRWMIVRAQYESPLASLSVTIVVCSVDDCGGICAGSIANSFLSCDRLLTAVADSAVDLFGLRCKDLPRGFAPRVVAVGVVV